MMAMCDLVGDGEKVGGEVGDAVGRLARPAALAVAAQIGRDEAETGHEVGHERIPPVRVPAVAVHEQDGGGVLGAPDETMQVQAAGVDVRVARTLSAGHRRGELVPVAHGRAGLLPCAPGEE